MGRKDMHGLQNNLQKVVQWQLNGLLPLATEVKGKVPILSRVGQKLESCGKQKGNYVNMITNKIHFLHFHSYI